MEHVSVLHHGEVQTTGSMFRKRTQYMVLTTTHLIRFKSQSRAAEVFPEIPASIGRSNSINHFRMSSGGSAPDMHAHTDPQVYLPLHNMVAVYKLDDGRPYFSIEIANYDESSNHVVTFSMQLNDPGDSELWLSSIRTAVTQAKLSSATTFGQKAIEYAARCVEAEGDYDPNRFSMFTVAQRTSKSGPRSSTDDLGKLVSSVCYLVVGLHKLHLVPLPRPSKSSSSTPVAEMAGPSHGVVNITAINVQELDDTFHITFRIPFQSPSTLYLASSSVMEIALSVHNAIDFQRPLWTEQPMAWQVPKSLEESFLPIPPADVEDYLCFDRTLTAYCRGYNIDPSNIRYSVNYDCEDAPEFSLMEPNKPRRRKYTSLELLAILRALRYNDSFHSISFRNIKLDSLHNIWDRCGSEHFSWSSKSGQSIKLPRLDQTPLLVQELQCLALKSSRLRRLDFSDSLSRRPRDLKPGERGSGICEAIFPLCALQLTNVDWISLTGVALSETDIEYLYAAAVKKDCHFRAIELARCALGDDLMEYAIQSILSQEDTLECLDLSNNPARLSPSSLGEQLGRFQHIRRLNLSSFSLSSGPLPILSPDVLLNWRLEYLNLSGTNLNTESVDSLAAYLMSEQSSTLRQLHVENCQMGGNDVAALLECMSSNRSQPRNLHLFVSGNRLEREHGRLTKAIAASSTPTHLTMQALEYSEERSFQKLLQALSTNAIIEYLDISRVSIPFDASAEACEKLRLVFESNTILKELDISGEHTHLEPVTLGRGLCDAVKGLEKNTTLETLRIENQALGLPGASALATVLQVNTSLRELHCENNEISLQAFMTLVNAVKDNKTLLYLPAMLKDRAWARAKLDRELNNALSPTGSSGSSTSSPTNTRSSVKRALSNSLPGARSLSSKSIDKPPLLIASEHELRSALSSIDRTWDGEIDRLAGYLSRNYSLASGMPLSDGEMGGSPSHHGTGGASRPPTSGTLMNAIKTAMLEGHTPVAEVDRQLGDVALEDEDEVDGLTSIAVAVEGRDGLFYGARENDTSRSTPVSTSEAEESDQSGEASN